MSYSQKFAAVVAATRAQMAREAAVAASRPTASPAAISKVARDDGDAATAATVYGWRLSHEARTPGVTAPADPVLDVARRLLAIGDAEFAADLADARAVADGDKEAAERLRQRRGWNGGVA